MDGLNQQSNEPTIEVDTNLVPPEGAIPGVQVNTPANEEVLFSTDENDYVLDPGEKMTPEQQLEEIKRLQAEMAKHEELQNQQQVFKSGFETMADKFGDVAKTQQEAYKKLQEQQAAELARLQQQQKQQTVQQPNYTDEQFATELFTNPGEATKKFLAATIGPVFQQQQQTIQQLRQQLDAVSSKSQHNDVYSKYGQEVELQAQQLAVQGVKNPYDLAAQIIRGRHAEDFVQQPQVVQEQQPQQIQQPQPVSQPARPVVQQSFSPTASQIPKGVVQQNKGKKRIPQSLYNEWVQEANEKGLDVEHWTHLKAKYYEG